MMNGKDTSIMAITNFLIHVWGIIIKTQDKTATTTHTQNYNTANVIVYEEKC